MYVKKGIPFEDALSIPMESAPEQNSIIVMSSPRVQRCAEGSPSGVTTSLVRIRPLGS